MSRARGLTLIEVVLASGMLVTLAGMILGGISFIENVRTRDVHRLNGMEVAHRLVAQYIDDPAALPDNSLPIQQGEHYYRWVMREELIELEDDGGTHTRRVRTRVSTSVPAIEQFGTLLRRVHIEVIRADPGDELRFPNPVARLDRIYSPIVGRSEEVMLQWVMSIIQQAQQQERNERRQSQEQQ